MRFHFLKKYQKCQLYRGYEIRRDPSLGRLEVALDGYELRYDYCAGI